MQSDIAFRWLVKKFNVLSDDKDQKRFSLSLSVNGPSMDKNFHTIFKLLENTFHVSWCNNLTAQKNHDYTLKHLIYTVHLFVSKRFWALTAFPCLSYTLFQHLAKRQDFQSWFSTYCLLHGLWRTWLCLDRTYLDSVKGKVRCQILAWSS